MKIRRLEPEEWRIYREVRLKALGDAPDAFGSTQERESRFSGDDWKKRLQRKDCVTIVGFTNDSETVGLIVGAPYDDEAGLCSMWVDRKQRQNGFGRTLVNAVIEWSREKGYSKLFLDVGDFNLAAIRLYEAAGFVRTGKAGTLPPPRDHISEHQRVLNF